jgi:pyruvate formate lyase activating enzyme
VDEVLEIVLRDRDYYVQSGGGLTLSGGEPLFQPDFAEDLLHAAKNHGLHCCIETSGYAGWDVLDRVRLAVDLWLFDYKETDPHRHAKFTGRELSTVVRRLQQLHDAGANILLRCPMIPGHNARREHLDGIVALTRRLPNLHGVELLPYFDLWRGKLKRLGLQAELPDSVKPPTPEAMKSWNDYLRDRGARVVG